MCMVHRWRSLCTMHFRSYITITLLVTTVPWIVSQNEVEFIGWVECHYRATHCDFQNEFLPPSWRHAHAHFGFAHRQQPLRWLKPFLKHWYVKLYELIAPHTLKWINSVIKLGHFVLNSIYCLSRMKFKDRWVIFFIYDSFCWTKSPTAASLGSRNDAM